MRKQMALEWMSGAALVLTVIAVVWAALSVAAALGLDVGTGWYSVDTTECSRTPDGFDC